MARIKILDIPRDTKVSKEEMKRIRGGALGVFSKIEWLSGDAVADKNNEFPKIITFDPLR